MILWCIGAAAIATDLSANAPDPADNSIRQFLAQDDTQRPYRATRRLEARNGDREGWLEATTDYSPDTGLRFDVTAEGGSGYIRSKVLRAVLEGEQQAIARGETARASIARANYTFQPNGLDDAGLANVLLSPRRKERILLAGKMFLRPEDGGLVRLEGRPAKNPSFWIKNVDVVRSYERILGTVVPVSLESTAQVRLLGRATFRMTYSYFEIDGKAVASQPSGWK